MIRFPVNNSMFMQPRHTPESAWIGHIPFASWLIEEMRPDILVELGTHRGASFLAFCQAVQACSAPTRCYAVDTWEGDEHAGEYGNEVFLPLQDYHQRNYAGFSRLMRMRFEEAVEYFDDGSVDLLHIDGLHTYESVRNDFESWQSKLSRRAVVLFHDINVRERGFGVWKYWEEIRSQYPSFAFTHTHGLGVLLVGPEQQQALLELCQLDDANGEAVIGNVLFDQLGKLINANIDIGTLAREQGRLAGMLHEREVARDAAINDTEVLRAHAADLQSLLEMRTAECAQLAQRNHELADLADAAGLVDQLRAQLHGCQVRHDDAQARVVHCENDIQTLRAQLHDASLATQCGVEQQLQRDAELQVVQTELQAVQAELARLQGSLSWRCMRPFRYLRRMFG